MNAEGLIREMVRERIAKGWTQYRLAKESGISREAIAKIERGNRTPNLATFIVLMESLGIEIELKKKGGNSQYGSGANVVTKTTKVTGKGQQLFINKFLRKGGE